MLCVIDTSLGRDDSASGNANDKACGICDNLPEIIQLLLFHGMDPNELLEGENDADTRATGTLEKEAGPMYPGCGEMTAGNPT